MNASPTVTSGSIRPVTAVIVALTTVLAIAAQTPPRLTHGIGTGDVSATTAVVWARADRAARMTVRYTPAVGVGVSRTVSAQGAVATNLAAQVTLTDLEPDTRYRYEVWFENTVGRSETDVGTFRTAPAADTRAPVSFIWAGDLGGHAYCRQVDDGYGIFRPMGTLRPDFFVANGDLIYADFTCPRGGPEPGWDNIPADFPGIASPDVDWRDRAEVEEVYAAHWRYNRADGSFQTFLRSVPMYVQWDDHEVINDFGAPWQADGAAPERQGYPNLVAAGRKALFDFHPIDRHPDEPERLYRSFRWGQDVELFLLDARSYRSANTLPDPPDGDKTLLGSAQLEWLKIGLARSSATWKLVSTDVPLSAPTGTRADERGRDAWANGPGAAPATATGFERELGDLLRSLDESDVRNLVFVSTDVHFAAQLRYEIDLDGDGDRLRFHELISGPLSALKAAPPAFDQTLQPVVLYAEGGIFNFGLVEIGDGSPAPPTLRTDIRDETGRVRPGSRLEIAPEG